MKQTSTFMSIFCNSLRIPGVYYSPLEMASYQGYTGYLVEYEGLSVLFHVAEPVTTLISETQVYVDDELMLVEQALVHVKQHFEGDVLEPII